MRSNNFNSKKPNLYGSGSQIIANSIYDKLTKNKKNNNNKKGKKK